MDIVNIHNNNIHVNKTMPKTVMKRYILLLLILISASSVAQENHKSFENGEWFKFKIR